MKAVKTESGHFKYGVFTNRVLSMPSWWPLLLGWPAVGLATILSVIGIAKLKPTILAIATIMVLPIGLYLAIHPRPGWFALFLPVLLAMAGLAVRLKLITAAWIMLTVFIAMSVLLAMMVLEQQI